MAIKMNIPEKILKAGIPIEIKTKGSSMQPFLRHGDILTIVPIEWDKTSPGDILAHTRSIGSDIICHRLLAKTGTLLAIKGDAFMRGPELISRDLVLGKVTSVKRKTKKIDLESKLQKSIAGKIAWVSYKLPVLTWLLGYFYEALSAPLLIPEKIINKINRSGKNAC